MTADGSDMLRTSRKMTSLVSHSEIIKYLVPTLSLDGYNKETSFYTLLADGDTL